jgi:hypothetical protein
LVILGHLYCKIWTVQLTELAVYAIARTGNDGMAIGVDIEDGLGAKVDAQLAGFAPFVIDMDFDHRVLLLCSMTSTIRCAELLDDD